MEPRLVRVIHVASTKDFDQAGNVRRYWLSRPPAERLATVEFLRSHTVELPPGFSERFDCLDAHRAELEALGE